MVEGCYVGVCEKVPEYTIKWYCLYDHGESPEVAGERNSCERFDHLLYTSYHDLFHEGFRWFPGEISDWTEPYKKHPNLVKKIIAILEQDNPKNQLELKLIEQTKQLKI